ncbi:Gfo/Idh/MocA family oxidoreductase, partial [Candidatus Bathyarchaeota archaeon]|nr:Gfo/Idh/MocA family oxidoreductase [Candidatus Bathyarchaeota archaeon]
FSEKYGVRYYLNAEEMVEQEKPDIVTIATKEEPRCQLTIMAARYGVMAIVAEKPMASNISEARRMVKV